MIILVLVAQFLLVSWNCNGTGRKTFYKEVKAIIEKTNPHILVLLDTRMDYEESLKIMKAFPFDNRAIAKARGHSGGIWVMWNDASVGVHGIGVDERLVHVQVYYQLMKK